MKTTCEHFIDQAIGFLCLDFIRTDVHQITSTAEAAESERAHCSIERWSRR